MKLKILLALLSGALAAPALANDAVESLFIGPALRVAQLAPEQRRMLRERWEQASPEERMAIRRQFQERLREQGGQWAERLPNPPGHADFAGMGGNLGGNYGSGFEQRRPPPPNPEDNATNFDPRESFNPYAGKRRR